MKNLRVTEKERALIMYLRNEGGGVAKSLAYCFEQATFFHDGGCEQSMNDRASLMTVYYLRKKIKRVEKDNAKKKYIKGLSPDLRRPKTEV